MYDFNTTITNEGAALLARIIANHENAAFKEVRLSETNYVGQEATLTAGTFGGVKDTDLVTVSVIDNTTIKVAFDFFGNYVVGEYDLYSIGVIIDDNGTDVLVAVCTSSDPLPIAASTSDRYAFNINLAVSSTQNITVSGTSAAVLYDTDVVNTLISTATDKPLSANMGRVLGENIIALENVYGAKNENSYPYEDTTKTDSGITFTDNGDGSVTVSGTAGANIGFNCHDVKRLTLPTGKHKISGCPAGGSGAWFINITEYINGVYSTLYSVDENGVEITADSTKSYGVIVWVASGTVISTPITFYPMIIDSRIVDDTFVPFAETNLQLTRKTSGLSNRNLLDNPWFTVNQRGATTITSGYGADRWKDTSGTVTFGSGGVTFGGTAAQIDQPLESILPNGTYTASVLLSDGTIISGTATKASDLVNTIFYNTASLTLFYRYNTQAFAIYSASAKTIRAVKLEVGTVSTLHLDLAPDYTPELLKCQWHFERVKLLGIGNSQSVIGIGYAVSATIARITIFAKSKRDIPTITTAGTFTLHDGSSVTAISYEEMTDSGIVVNATSSGLTSGNVYLLRLGDTSSYIDFASDL